VSAPPPFDDPDLLSQYIQSPPVDPAQRHLAIFLGDVRAVGKVPVLRSFLKLYTSLDASKLANFLDDDEEELVQQLMGLKLACRSVSRAGIEGGRLLDGETISTSDTDFAINEVRHLVRLLRIFNGLKSRAERGEHCRVYHRKAIRFSVHSKHGVCGADIRQSAINTSAKAQATRCSSSSAEGETCT